jgi:hypothetical protein
MRGGDLAPTVSNEHLCLGSSMIWLPGSVFRHEGIFEDDALSYDGGAGDLGLFAIGDAAVVEGFECWVEARRGAGGHRADAGDRNEDHKAPGAAGVAGDQPIDLEIEIGDRGIDGAELALACGGQPRCLDRAGLVENGGSRGNRGGARVLAGSSSWPKFLQAQNQIGWRRNGARVEAFADESQRRARRRPPVLAHAPTDSANNRERSGLTLAAAKPRA